MEPKLKQLPEPQTLALKVFLFNLCIFRTIWLVNILKPWNQNSNSYRNTLVEAKKFLLGDSISVADFTMYISLDWHSKLDEGFLAKFPILDNYLKTIESEPKVKAYLESDKHMAARCPPFAPGAKVLNK